jgi:L-fuculose-phosphate aldolase
VSTPADAVAEYARRLHAQGWVANHDGNVSVRLGPRPTAGAASERDAGRFLATPTATSKAAVTADGLVLVDDAGQQVGGRGKPFSEMGLHLAVYRERGDVQAVIHAHPPTATGFAVAGVPLDPAFLAEAVVSLGPGVPTVPFAPPGAAAARALAPYAREHDAVLLGGHGVLTWGPDLETAYLRMELVEHLARIALVARQLGGVRPLPASVLPQLAEARAKAGLGRSAGANAAGASMSSGWPGDTGAAAPGGEPPSAPRTVVACAPAPPGSDVVVYEKPRALPSPSQLAEIIRQEIAAALRK